MEEVVTNQIQRLPDTTGLLLLSSLSSCWFCWGSCATGSTLLRRRRRTVAPTWMIGRVCRKLIFFTLSTKGVKASQSIFSALHLHIIRLPFTVEYFLGKYCSTLNAEAGINPKKAKKKERQNFKTHPAPATLPSLSYAPPTRRPLTYACASYISFSQLLLALLFPLCV